MTTRPTKSTQDEQQPEEEEKGYKKKGAVQIGHFFSCQASEKTSGYLRPLIIVVMALLHNQSCPCSKSETDLFNVPPTQNDILGGQFHEYKPLNAVTADGPLEFTVSGTPDSYLDLAQTQLYVKAKITLPDGSNLPADAPCGPVNLFLHSLFNQVDVHLNDRMVSTASNTYAYRAMMETLLTYGFDAKTSHLTSGLFYKDTPGKMDAVDPTLDDDNANLGLKKRSQFTTESGEIDLVGMIHADIF